MTKCKRTLEKMMDSKDITYEIISRTSCLKNPKKEVFTIYYPNIKSGRIQVLFFEEEHMQILTDYDIRKEKTERKNKKIYESLKQDTKFLSKIYEFKFENHNFAKKLLSFVKKLKKEKIKIKA